MNLEEINLLYKKILLMDRKGVRERMHLIQTHTEHDYSAQRIECIIF